MDSTARSCGAWRGDWNVLGVCDSVCADHFCGGTLCVVASEYSRGCCYHVYYQSLHGGVLVIFGLQAGKLVHRRASSCQASGRRQHLAMALQHRLAGGPRHGYLCRGRGNRWLSARQTWLAFEFLAQATHQACTSKMISAATASHCAANLSN